jgi:hypothetical protein
MPISYKIPGQKRRGIAPIRISGQGGKPAVAVAER